MASLSSVSLSTSSSETSIFRSTNWKISVLPTGVVRTFPDIKKSRKQINYVAYVQPPDVNRPQSSIRSTSFNVEGTGHTTSVDEVIELTLQDQSKFHKVAFAFHLRINHPVLMHKLMIQPLLALLLLGQLVYLPEQNLSSIICFVLQWSTSREILYIGYSRKNLTEEDLRAIIAPTLSCRIDHQESCEEKMDAFLKRTFYLYGGVLDNREGMSKLNTHGKLRIFYLTVPQDALIDIASSLAEKAQTQRAWNRVIIEKPFGLDHLFGKNTIENLAVLRFSNLVFMPLWNRSYIHNIQVISEELGMQNSARYPYGYGILGDVVHSHIFQTVALLAMEPPVTLDGEDVRYEKVYSLYSYVILGHCEADSGSNFKDTDNLMPTYFGAVLHIDNARWDGLGMNLEASELNLLYKDKYNVDVTDSYEQLLHDVIDGDNHLFMRSDEVEAAWNILSPQKKSDFRLMTLAFESRAGIVGHLFVRFGVCLLDELERRNDTRLRRTCPSLKIYYKVQMKPKF
ncbi:glucose-6-phosphate 1-dehydrogenase [Datura stramonium]|uniref:Glucose-6-phosphate 1-dehydrogenase n=1 Tax=Datura stramonium TaxID=4076 RepID=A0ABS8UW56_DATST|nr:glucose-6-phosphate 1-dehydrogenase [Datura stramonium]